MPSRSAGLLFVVAALSIMPACGALAPGLPKPRPPAKAKVVAHRDELAAAAAELDPGPVQPLATRWPPPLMRLLTASATRGPASAKIAAARALTARLERAVERGRGKVDDAVLADVMNAISDLEPIAFREEQSADSAAAADLLAYLYDFGGTAASWRMHKAALRTDRERLLDEAGFGDAVAMLAGADELARAAAARSLRVENSAAHAFDVLAKVREKAGDHEGVKKARLAHLARAGRDASAFDVIAVARACYVALDVACGDEALARARKTAADEGIEAERLLAEEAVRREHARTYLGTRASASFEDRLARARAALRLERVGEARDLLVALAAEAPKDARPLTYIARAGLVELAGKDTEKSLRDASEILERAGTLDRKNEDFDDAALGSNGMLFAYDLSRLSGAGGDEAAVAKAIKRLGERLGAVAHDIRARDPARGESVELVLHILVGITELGASKDRHAVGSYIREQVDTTMALATKYPQSDVAAALARAFGQLGRTRAAATAALDVAIPKGAMTWDLQQNALRARIATAAIWNAPERLPDEPEIFDGVEPGDDVAGAAHMLAADAAFVRELRAGKRVEAAAWKAVAEKYLDAFARAPDDHRVRILTNAASRCTPRASARPPSRSSTRRRAAPAATRTRRGYAPPAYARRAATSSERGPTSRAWSRGPGRPGAPTSRTKRPGGSRGWRRSAAIGRRRVRPSSSPRRRRAFHGRRPSGSARA